MDIQISHWESSGQPWMKISIVPGMSLPQGSSLPALLQKLISCALCLREVRSQRRLQTVYWSRIWISTFLADTKRDLLVHGGHKRKMSLAAEVWGNPRNVQLPASGKTSLGHGATWSEISCHGMPFPRYGGKFPVYSRLLTNN